jgi:hypothetical protein
MKPHHKSVTLIELLIAISILGLLVISLSSIDLFSRFHVITSDRRAKSQNEASYAVDHMTKNIARAVGDINNFPVYISPDGQLITVWVDSDGDGRRGPGDQQIAYQSVAVQRHFIIRYYPNYANINDYEEIARNVTRFYASLPENLSDGNYVNVFIQVCWDPEGRHHPCGTMDNPTAQMNVNIKMPSVSVH